MSRRRLQIMQGTKNQFIGNRLWMIRFGHHLFLDNLFGGSAFRFFRLTVIRRRTCFRVENVRVENPSTPADDRQEREVYAFG